MPATPWICSKYVPAGESCTQLLSLPNASEVAVAPLLNERMVHVISKHPLLARHEVVALLPSIRGSALRLLRMGNGSGRGAYRPPAFAYNPSLIDHGDNVLVRLSSYSWCSLNESHHPVEVKRFRSFVKGRESRELGLKTQFSVTLWLDRRHAAVRGAIPDSSDARAIRLGGRVHAIFKRSCGCAARRSTIWLASLEPRYREVELRYNGASAIEANWTPFTIDGLLHGETGGGPVTSRRNRLFLSYISCPHRVLECDPHTGECVVAHEVSAQHGCPAYQAEPGINRAPMAAHGGSQLQLVHGTRAWGDVAVLLAIHHFKLYSPWAGQAWWYLHAFAAYDRHPPFALLNFSRPFVLPGAFRMPFRDRIQFAAGLAVVGQHELLVSYGVGDCTSMVLRLPLQTALDAALDGGGAQVHPDWTHLQALGVYARANPNASNASATRTHAHTVRKDWLKPPSAAEASGWRPFN